MINACICFERVRDRGAKRNVAVVNASKKCVNVRGRGASRKFAAVDVCNCVLTLYYVFALFASDPALNTTL